MFAGKAPDGRILFSDGNGDPVKRARKALEELTPEQRREVLAGFVPAKPYDQHAISIDPDTIQ